MKPEEKQRRTGIALAGCGFIADAYVRSILGKDRLQIIGVTDRDPQRALRLGAHFGIPAYKSLDEALADDRVEIIVNLTTPQNHYEVTRKCLESGKHVYSEKPVALDLSQAKELFEYAKQKGLYLGCAPCSVLGPTAQTLWAALGKKEIGEVRLAYAEIDEGPIYMRNPEEWKNSIDCPWPYENEYVTGCTLEHAAYYVSWLVAFFGAAKSITAFSSCLVPQKTHGVGKTETPDFSSACILFNSGVVARITCSIVAPYNHGLRLIGDRGTLSIDECWNCFTPVSLERYTSSGFRLERYPWAKRIPFLLKVMGHKILNYPLVKKGVLRKNKRVCHDFAAGVDATAVAIREGKASLLPPDYCLHVTEIILAIQNAYLQTGPYVLQSTCEQITPVGADATFSNREREYE